MHLLFLLLPPSPFFFCYCSSPLTGMQPAYHFAPTSWVSLSLKSHVVLLRGQVSASQTMVGITTIIAQEFLKTSSCPASHSGNLPWRSPRACSSQGWWAPAGVGRTARSHWRGWGLNRLWPHHPPWAPPSTPDPLLTGTHTGRCSSTSPVRSVEQVLHSGLPVSKRHSEKVKMGI